jgi:hypothetical protein
MTRQEGCNESDDYKDIREFIPNFCQSCKYNTLDLNDLPCRVCRPIYNEPTYFIMQNKT